MKEASSTERVPTREFLKLDPQGGPSQPAPSFPRQQLPAGCRLSPTGRAVVKLSQPGEARLDRKYLKRGQRWPKQAIFLWLHVKFRLKKASQPDLGFSVCFRILARSRGPLPLGGGQSSIFFQPASWTSRGPQETPWCPLQEHPIKQQNGQFL